MKAALPLAPLLLLAACGSNEPESAANILARTENAIIEREKALNAQVENELSQAERRLDEEASQALNSLNAAAANSADAADAAGEGAAAPATETRARRRP